MSALETVVDVPERRLDGSVRAESVWVWASDFVPRWSAGYLSDERALGIYSNRGEQLALEVA